MASVLMTTRLPCAVCGLKHRTHSQRISPGRWVVLCASCHAAVVRLKEWQRANPSLDVVALLHVYGENVPKPASKVAAAKQEKSA